MTGMLNDRLYYLCSVQRLSEVLTFLLDKMRTEMVTIFYVEVHTLIQLCRSLFEKS
jgi:hypothetical protein